MLKKTLLFSFCCHLGVFSLFNFTFGNKIPRINFAGVSFLGAILRPADFQKFPLVNKPGQQIFNRLLVDSSLNRTKTEKGIGIPVYIKPQTLLSLSGEKSAFLPRNYEKPPLLKPSASVVMLYPHLPQQFLLYFKDRQSVHIELVFNLVSQGRFKTIIMNRKISSGNLEADLLSKRYLGHYLFVRQAAFPQDSWQTVKIDLSAKGEASE